MTVYVPAEDSITASMTLDQSVMLSLQELGVQNPTMDTIDQLVDRIMDGSPGSDLEQSVLKADPNDTVMMG